MEHGEAPAQESRHSKTGLTSLVIAIPTTVGIVVLFVIRAIIGASTLSGTDPQSLDPRSLQDSPAFAGFALVGLGFLVCLIMYFVGPVLGLVGVFQRRRKRLFAILGTVANGLAVLVIVSLLVLGAIGASGGGAAVGSGSHPLFSSVLMRSRISSCSGVRVSSTTRPSARKTTRSAVAAARGSWVTMMIVCP